jgi:hypothetical protein
MYLMLVMCLVIFRFNSWQYDGIHAKIALSEDFCNLQVTKIPGLYLLYWVKTTFTIARECMYVSSPLYDTHSRIL